MMPSRSPDHGRTAGQRGGQQAAEAGRAPAPAGRLDQRVREQPDGRRQQQSPQQVRPDLRDAGSRLSGTTRTASTTAATPTGTLIQNTHRQFTWTRLPPITGPSAAPSAPSADQVPSAFARP